MALSKPVYWRGSQWAVTRYGVQALDGKYDIEKKRVWEEDNGYGWEQHMKEKGWVDMADFRQALQIARARWPDRS